ncbi:MAG TPA: hypothetical protein VFF05_03325 [Rudaea sp.]|jgi:hypothetical protein|nr:hypothetical protein [Rudaea sp.]
MRQAILFVLGLAVGAIAAANIVSTLRQRDAYPRGLMNVMQHDTGVLHDAARADRCDAATQGALERLHGLAGEIETAVYGAEPPDPPFAEYAQRLRTAIPSSLECKSLPQALDRVGAACDDCHRQYR